MGRRRHEERQLGQWRTSWWDISQRHCLVFLLPIRWVSRHAYRTAHAPTVLSVETRQQMPGCYGHARHRRVVVLGLWRQRKQKPLVWRITGIFACKRHQTLFLLLFPNVKFLLKRGSTITKLGRLALDALYIYIALNIRFRLRKLKTFSKACK